MVDTDNRKPTEQANFVGAGITLLVIIAIMYFVDLGSVKEWVLAAGVWGPLVFILLKISTIVFAPLSGSPLYPLVGLLFGFWPGVLYVEIGDFLGYTIAFSLSRKFGKKLVAKFLSEKEEGLMPKIIEHVGTPKGFFHACLTLFAMPELLAYGAGLSRLPYRTFILIITPLSVLASSVLVFFGSLLDVESNSAYLSFGIPFLGALAVLLGGFLFTKEVMKKK